MGKTASQANLPRPFNWDIRSRPAADDQRTPIADAIDGTYSCSGGGDAGCMIAPCPQKKRLPPVRDV